VIPLQQVRTQTQLIFREPVTLTCNHSFCSSCLKTFWEKTKKKNCPTCKSWTVCSEHEKEPQLFCVDEDKPLCPVCDFPHHQSHRVIPVESAIDVLKIELKSDLKSLAEFNKLQQFLKEEEESRLAALREEEEQKGRTISREMKMIEEQISSLSDSISAVEEELQKHSVPFLSSYKDTQSRARAQSSVSDPQLVSGALIDLQRPKKYYKGKVIRLSSIFIHSDTSVSTAD
uniref:RING-type domain-containing protein n=1 Tax=Astatotilapia calliptera TaxID=8154 RepID=A0AAX7SN84_ASTCA